MRNTLALALVWPLLFAACGTSPLPPGPVAENPDPDPQPPEPVVPPPVLQTDQVIVAHRGASGYAPEHTLMAYDLALEMGAEYIEQDVLPTADGVLVCIHDDTLDRTDDVIRADGVSPTA